MSNPYLDPARVRAALRGLNLRPTRGMGQNFLVDAHALHTIVDAADLTPDDVVIEVGPGLGVLTWELLQRTGHVIAVELDKRLAARLRHELIASVGTQRAADLHIVQGDVLDLSPGAIVQAAYATWQPEVPPARIPAAYKVVANLPYAITSPVLRHFLEATPQPTLIVVLVQWEVAQRITAAPGDFSMLAHAIQMYATPELVARVTAEGFLPVPAVDSAILRLWVRPAPVVTVDDEHTFFRLLKAGFLQPRKKLSNALPKGLAALGVACTREQAVAALGMAAVDPQRRAETVTLEEWAEVYRALRPILTAQANNTTDV